MTENQIFNDLFLQYDDSDRGYTDPFNYDVVGKCLMALGLETLVFHIVNILIELFLDDIPPFGSSSSASVLSLKSVSKIYKTLQSKFKAVDEIRYLLHFSGFILTFLVSVLMLKVVNVLD